MKTGMYVRMVGTRPETFLRAVELTNISVKKAMRMLGVVARDHMRNTIETSRRRPGGTRRLQNAIEVERNETAGEFHVGVGRISLLPAYWAIINYGGLSGVALRGKYVPGYFGNHNPPIGTYKGTSALGEKKEQFHYVPQIGGYDTPQRYFMKPTSPIAPCNYIEKARNYVSLIIRMELDKASKVTNIVTR